MRLKASGKQRRNKKEMNSIEFSGRSQGKGRHGYFRLYNAAATDIPSDPDGQALHLDFYPKRRVSSVGPLHLLLTIEDAMALGDFLRRIARADASAEDRARRTCVRLRISRYSARLEESGHQICHELVEICGESRHGARLEWFEQGVRRRRCLLVDLP
jgi:hypothetical protein